MTECRKILFSNLSINDFKQALVLEKILLSKL